LLAIIPDSPQALYDFVSGLLSEHGYLIVFLGASVDFGIPSAGDIVMLAGGLFANNGLNLGLVMLAGVIGAMVSENTMYWTGRIGGRRFASRASKLRLPRRLGAPRYLALAEEYFNTHGGKTVVLGRLVPGFRAAIPLTAGLTGMSYPRFLAFDMLAVILWAMLVGTVGFLFGEYWETLVTAIRSAGPVVVGLVLLSVLVYVYLRRWRTSR
jgi:membrane protein DedA with SNARE-associated domain